MTPPAAPRPTASGGVCPAERPAVDTPPGTPQPEAPPDALFAALLDIQTTARTAPAEGQTTETPDAPAATPATDTADAADATATDATELAAALPVAPPLAPATPATPAVPAAPAHAASPVTEAPATALPEAGAPRAQPATPAVPAHDVAQPENPATQPAQAAQPEKPAAKPAGKKEAGPGPGLPAPPAKLPAAEAKETPKQDAPAARPEAGPVAPPKDSAPAVQGPPDPRPVLRGERIEALVRLATRHGAAEARMELHPQELGSVVVRLRVTSDGLQATFTASNPEAVTQLQQAGEDLRRSLEAKGLTLATLDVRAQGDERREHGRGRHHGPDRRRDPVIEDDATTLTTTATVPAGVLVDVHA
jgi:flagellar hook-length control protein FliK